MDNNKKEYISKVINAFDAHEKIILFGAGFLGEKWKEMLVKFGLFKGFIDNDGCKQSKEKPKNPIYDIVEGVEQRALIVISVAPEFSKEISAQLSKYGLLKDYDYVSLDRFEKEWFPIILLHKFNILYTNLAQICVTERCTLKCKKCAHACNLVPITSEDMSLEEAKKSADYFFDTFDMINEFVLIGGEPFLYRHIGELIEYICEKYKEKIMLFTITTNGTILPREEILEICKKNNIVIRISDYSNSLPKLLSNYNKLYTALDEHKIQYLVWKTDDHDSWYDYGFDVLERKNTDESIYTFENCKTMCREIKESRYYYCVMAHTVAENMGLDFGKEDYLDLNQDLSKEDVLLFELGDVPKGYLDVCSICRGKEAIKNTIPAAEQM